MLGLVLPAHRFAGLPDKPWLDVDLETQVEAGGLLPATDAPIVEGWFAENNEHIARIDAGGLLQIAHDSRKESTLGFAATTGEGQDLHYSGIVALAGRAVEVIRRVLVQHLMT